MLRHATALVLVAAALLAVTGTASGHSTNYWAWYARWDTQCVVNHEGGWKSVNRAGYYGRFQMDVSFQTETSFGKWAFRRWGTANHWPHWAQVKHAYEVWRYSGWSRWPTYARYCN